MTRTDNKKNPLTLPYILGIAAALAIVTCFAGYNFVYGSYDGATKKLIIPDGATENAIADSLKGIDPYFAMRVKTIWKAAGGKPSKASGYYLVESGMSPLDLARKLKRGEQTPVKLTFNNIRTIDQLAEKVASTLSLTAADFMSAADSVLPEAGFRSRAEYPAAFIPDSYEFYWNASAEKVVSTLLRYRNRFWDGERRGLAKEKGLTPVQVATIASIVEEESGKTEERPVIAALYINRLRKGMPLQADPTVKFAIGDFSIRRITGNMLKTQSPYNTYIHDGLPPGPIRIPDKRTLQQVLDAPEHAYLYMCAREDFSGYHNFAEDFATHTRNAAKYRAELNRRGIK